MGKSKEVLVNEQKINRMLAAANRKFAGKWFIVEDRTFIGLVDRVVYNGKKTGKIPDDPRELPLHIHMSTFVNDCDVPLNTSRIVDLHQNTTFDVNPYSMNSVNNNKFSIEFITKAEAKRFAGRIRYRLKAELAGLKEAGL